MKFHKVIYCVSSTRTKKRNVTNPRSALGPLLGPSSLPAVLISNPHTLLLFLVLVEMQQGNEHTYFILNAGSSVIYCTRSGDTNYGP